jgi:hypothetical protein
VKAKNLVASFRNFSPLDAALFPSDITRARRSVLYMRRVELHNAQEPKATLGSPFLRCTIAAMKKGAAPKSRRRSLQPLGRKTFVYLAEEERTLIDKAAAAERRSVSSFIANAAVEAAERIVARHRRS